tara:strand:- start:431 stop:847 length:417 start_codon:yes stop_codon:yes gene_type:complete
VFLYPRLLKQCDKGRNTPYFSLLLSFAFYRDAPRFATDNGYTGIVIVNLFAFRATKPKDLFSANDPVGPMNELHISEQTIQKDVCCAWGANAPPDRVQTVKNVLAYSEANTLCLGITKSGAPRHPLYVIANQKLVNYC